MSPAIADQLATRAGKGSRRAADTIANRAAARPRRTGVTAALAAGAVVAPSPLSPILGLTALLLALDQLIPMPGRTWSEADDRFWRLVRARRASARRCRVRGRPPERLDLVDPGAYTPQRSLGVQSVALESITGTVEPAKQKAFDRRFRPESRARDRWKALWMATANSASLPPVDLYRVHGTHVVRDGHHRISVARDLGMATIDADVVELG